MRLYKTTENLTSENYPYGFRLKTTKTDYLEFDKKRGFRHCSYTINPKTSLQNKPKKGTYNDIMILGKNEENNYTESLTFSFYDHEDIDKITAFLSKPENFALFTTEQVEYIYIKFLAYTKIAIQGQVVYCGSKPEDLLPLFSAGVNLIVKGIKDKGAVNYFDKIKFDWEKIDSFKVKDYQPFKIKSYGI